ncbi:MAG: ISAs1 family transposase, partial [Planctomycetia bacterium]
MAAWIDVGGIGSYFESLEDPRDSRNRKHLLVDVVVIVVAGMICHGDGPTAVHRWAVARADWLKQFLELPNGIPSRDCLRRILSTLKPKAFQECFQAWTAAAVKTVDDGSPTLIAIDGKTCRGSHDRGKGLGPLHLVSAWAGKHGIALGQVATAEKSNEITAIPELLERLDLNNTVVTIDAMGCQKEIVKAVAEGGGTFVVTLKENQPKLYEAVADFFEKHIEANFEELSYRCHETREAGHGRVEERAYYLAKIPNDFPCKKEWPEVKAVGYALRMTTHADGAESYETRYYVAGRYLSAETFAAAVRGHWSIEAMHWVLDVTFREDEHRSRDRTLVENLSWLRRFAVTLLKRHPKKDSIRGKMQFA